MRALFAAAAALLGSVAAAAALAQPVASKATYTYANINGAALKADVYTTAASPYGQRRPAVVFVHGGGWTCGNRDAFLGWPRHLAEAYGVVAITMSYRLAPVTDAVLGADGRIAYPGTRDGCSVETAPSDDLGLPGHRAPFPAQLQDLRAFMWQLRLHADALLVDRHRIAVVGASAGGHLAGALGALDSVPWIPPAGLAPGEVYSRPNALVSIAGPWNLSATAALPHTSTAGILRNLFGGESTLAQRVAASPTSYLDGSSVPPIRSTFPPTLFIHGEQDTLVPAQQSIEACALMMTTCATGQPLIVQTPANVDPHDTLYLLQKRYDAFIAFLAQTIAAPPPGNQ
ncbi:MAG TPA: alpha/beta hydrolase [Aquabacterium sp.]|nr:alpha/beta hydrolase [Aquabacterium sp.]